MPSLLLLLVCIDIESGKSNNKNIATIIITNGLGFANTLDIFVHSYFEYDDITIIL
jgi:hypothetical protein